METQLEPLLKLGAELLFYLALLAVLIHFSILAFHWLSYGGHARTNIGAILLYSIGGAILLSSLYLLLSTL